jgi:sortase (surface protein transpeptidase)
MSTVDKKRGRRGLLLLAAASLTVSLVGSMVGCGAPARTASPPSPATERQLAAPPPDRPAEVAAMPRSEPASVDIPKIGARSTLVPLGVNVDNTVQVPPITQPLQAGWYSYSPTPGELGPAVILGHVDGNKQKGIFYRLKEMAPGDKVAVTRKDGSTANFVVTKVDQVPKDTFPTPSVYDDTPDPELRLITCGGAFDHQAHNYLDNIIVYAKLAPP